MAAGRSRGCPAADGAALSRFDVAALCVKVGMRDCKELRTVYSRFVIRCALVRCD